MKKRREILLIIPALIIFITLLIETTILIEEPLYLISEEFCGCHQVVPSYLFLTLGILSLLSSIPLSYYFISKRMDERMEKQISILSGIISKGDNTSSGKNLENKSKSILRFFKADERRVIKRLLMNKGMMLQSEISKMKGMTKLKAHRIIKDMEKKGIVMTERYGKTKKIFLKEDFKSLGDNL